MIRIASLLLALIVLLSFTNCGRKQRTLFQFPEKDAIKINRLALPVVHGLQAKMMQDGVLLTWYAIDQEAMRNIGDMPVQFIGYHVYRLVAGSFVSRKPLTKNPKKETMFFDSRHGKKVIKKHSYLVRAVFKYEKRIIVGPASQVASGDCK